MFAVWTLVHVHAFLSFSVHLTSGEENKLAVENMAAQGWSFFAFSLHGWAIFQSSYVGIYQNYSKDVERNIYK